MKLPRLPAKDRLFHQTHLVCWFSSQALLLSWDTKKQKLPLTAQSGFSGGQIEHVDRAVATLTQALADHLSDTRAPLAVRTATVFVASMSSPLERQLVRRVFQKTGFQKITLVSYATAVRTFAHRQNLQSGIGIYVGADVAEIELFSPENQTTLSLDLSLSTMQHAVAKWLQEETQLEVSAQGALTLYQAVGKKKEPAAQTVRGRNSKKGQVETRTLSATQVGVLREVLRKKIAHELQEAVVLPLFSEVSSQRWIVVGDGFVSHSVEELFQAETLFLPSEFELTQGVTWLS